MTQKTEKKTYDIIMNIYSDTKDNFYSIENDNLEINDIFQNIQEIEENIVLVKKYIKKLNIYELIFEINDVSATTYKNNIKSIKPNLEWISNQITKIINYKPKETLEKIEINRNHLPPEMWPSEDRIWWEEHVKFRAKQASEIRKTEEKRIIEL